MLAQQALHPQNHLRIKRDNYMNPVCLQVTDIVRCKQSLATSPWQRIIVDQLPKDLIHALIFQNRHMKAVAQPGSLR